jgi:hypothetical protein
MDVLHNYRVKGIGVFGESNIVTNNTLVRCGTGVYIGESSLGNQIYYNTFIDNIEGATDYGINTRWDDDISLGNYWTTFPSVNDRWPEILDNAPPVISPVQDFTVDIDITTPTITWIASDRNPASYYLYLDNVLVEQGEWNGSALTFVFDDLDPGEYNITLILTDYNGNMESSQVTMIIIRPANPFLSTLGMTLVMFVTIGLPVIFIGVYLFLKRKPQ